MYLSAEAKTEETGEKLCCEDRLPLQWATVFNKLKVIKCFVRICIVITPGVQFDLTMWVMKEACQ